MKNYIVIESNSRTDFDYRVSSALNAGYEIAGGLSVQQIILEEGTRIANPVRVLHFAQGMVKTV